MNYYKRHIGDYAKKARHLTTLEHGVYTLLLDAYYDRECGPTKAEAIRQAQARTPDELAAVDAVLADFFTLTDGGRYRQERVEEEFRKAEEIARANAENGKRGGRPRKPKGKRIESESVLPGKRIESEVKANTNRSESEKNPNPLIHQSTNSEELESANADLSPAAPDDDPAAGDAEQGDEPGRPPCPHKAIIALYHEILPELRRVREWNDNRRKILARRWAESHDRQSLDWWREYFGYVRKSDFLMGKTTGRDGRSFDCDLEWLVRPANFAKVVEGKYE